MATDQMYDERITYIQDGLSSTWLYGIMDDPCESTAKYGHARHNAQDNDSARTAGCMSLRIPRFLHSVCVACIYRTLISLSLFEGPYVLQEIFFSPSIFI